MNAGNTDNDDSLARYNRGIGERIRAIRSQRGIIRKDLSARSNVSQRYLAQAETGQANISIAVLWRIAQALQVNLIELLPENGADAASINAPLLALLSGLNAGQQREALTLLSQRFTHTASRARVAVRGVALIGLRGAGKTSLGDRLASEFGVPFVRLGELIQQLAQMDVAELFSLGGQNTYRRLEKQALRQVLTQHPLAVVEAGGSLVSQADTFQFLLASYFTVWVKASPQEHMSRVMEQGDLRPMAGNRQAMQDLKLILAEREPQYRLANYMLDTSGRELDDCANELIDQTTAYLGASSSI